MVSSDTVAVRMILIDTWAQALAIATAEATGWRASNVYAFVVAMRKKDRMSDAAIQSVIDLAVTNRIYGEDFTCTTERIAAIWLAHEQGGDL